jgi:hypothetical protein
MVALTAYVLAAIAFSIQMARQHRRPSIGCATSAKIPRNPHGEADHCFLCFQARLWLRRPHEFVTFVTPRGIRDT